MKKILAIILAVLMAATMSVTAFADTVITDTNTSDKGQTIVSFNVAPTYTVTIPTSITLVQMGNEADGYTYENTMAITADNVRLEEGNCIYVTMERALNDFELTLPSGYTLPYDVIVDGTSVQDLGYTVAAFNADGSETMTFKAGNPQYAGEYTDTVTFTISVAPELVEGGGTDPDGATSDAGNQNNA